MKTITMDFDTYQKEIGDRKDHYEKGFDDGAKENQKRLDPLINILRDAVNGKENRNLLDLRKLLKDAGEL